MKVLHVFNRHRGGGGADNDWDQTIRYSMERGLRIKTFVRDSKTLSEGLAGKGKAFFSGIYSRGAVREFSRMLDDFQPDIVHAHELMPLITPWILPVCVKARVPVTYTCYDYRLTCPVFTHFRNGKICHNCEGGHEYQAVLNNCRGSYPESLAYALWNSVARWFNLHAAYVSQFIVQSVFGKEWLMRQNIPQQRISVVPCGVIMADHPVDPARGEYIAFAGRFVTEKGIEVLVRAARKIGLPVKLAGNFASHPAIAPGDPVQCVTVRSPEELVRFYRNARMLVVPSIWYETFGLVAAEAMAHGVPVIASRIGALKNTVEDGVSGLLFETNNADDLADKMNLLWQDDALTKRLGEGAFRLAKERYNPSLMFDRLLTAYDRANRNPYPFNSVAQQRE